MLPVLYIETGLGVVDEDTGEVLALQDAPDRAVLAAAEKVAELDRDLLQAKRALAAEIRDRHGVGTVHAGGFSCVVAESQSWPIGATSDALDDLVVSGAISQANADRAMPSKPKPDNRQLKALIGRLLLSDPESAKALSRAATVSPPSLRDVRSDSVDTEAA